MERVSELKQKIIKGIRTSGLQEWGRILTSYDDIAGYEDFTDEDINELATDILNEISEQPTLNSKQEKMLEEVIEYYGVTTPKTVLNALEHLSMTVFLLDEMDGVTEDDCIIVTQAFLDWALEQEEKQCHEN